MAEQKSSSALAAPLRNAASTMRKVPGVGVVTKAAEGTLDKIGTVSPRGRRMAVYAGAGVLGVAGLVEWPVAVTGAAVAWLTQPRPEPDTETAHPEMAGSVPEDMTDSAGHGVYVATGDAATAPPTAGTVAPGPVGEDEMPGGAAATSATPAPPFTDPMAPPAAPPTPSTAEDTPPAAPTTPPTTEDTPPTTPTTPTTPPTTEDTPPTTPTTPPNS
ncbi:hypothetical protein ACGFZQ_47760 [Streptomyces sp. NPDC048254]|uniref:hypothetical protein n=1 Tax=Streptomyces sp. NPDC048254 TaxID=3365525 RepID=UPI00372476C6